MPVTLPESSEEWLEAQLWGGGGGGYRGTCAPCRVLFTQHFVVSILRHSVCNRLTLIGASLFDFHWYHYDI